MTDRLTAGGGNVPRPRAYISAWAPGLTPLLRVTDPMEIYFVAQMVNLPYRWLDTGKLRLAKVSRTYQLRESFYKAF